MIFKSYVRIYFTITGNEKLFLDFLTEMGESDKALHVKKGFKPFDKQFSVCIEDSNICLYKKPLLSHWTDEAIKFAKKVDGTVTFHRKTKSTYKTQEIFRHGKLVEGKIEIWWSKARYDKIEKQSNNMNTTFVCSKGNNK